MPDAVTIEVALPSLIDGNPFEVERRILADLDPAMDRFAEWIDSAAKQLANTERSRILIREPAGITGEEMAELYDDTDRAATLARMQGAAKALVAAAAELTR